MDTLSLTIAELPKAGGPKRDTAYKAIKAGRLRAVKEGRRTLILVDDLKKYLTSLPAIAPQVEPAQHTQPGPKRRRGKSA